MTGSAAKGRRLRLGIAVLLVALVVWPLFAGGMYRESYQLAAVWHVAAAVAGIVALAAAEGRRLVWTPVRVAALALWAAYALSALISPSTPRAALQGLIKQSLYLGMLLTASEFVVSGRPGQRGLVTVSALALGVWGGVAVMALACLGAAAGLVPSDFILGGRIYTYIDYPNSAGALFAAAFLLGLGVRRACPSGWCWVPVVMAVGQWSLLTALLLTLSRGAWLVFPLALAVLLLLWPRGQRLAVAIEAVLLGAAALAVGLPWLSHLGQPMPGVALFGAGLASAVLGGWLARRAARLSARRALLCLAAAAVAGLAVVAGLQAAGLLPESLVSRIAGFSLSERSAWERIEWTRDAFEIVKDHPVFGVGGGGWVPRYFQYQRYPYYTREVHNGFAQTWVEAGSLGLAALLGLIALSGLAARRSCRLRHEDDPGKGMLLSGLAAGAAMVVLHSAIDLDLSLGCVGVLLWAMLGMIDGLAAGEGGEARTAASPGTGAGKRGADRKAPGPPGVSTSGILLLGGALMLSVVSASLFVALRVEDRAIRLYERGDYQASREAFALACRLDPLSPRLRLERAAVLETVAGQTRDPADSAEARSQLEAAVRLDPYNPDHHALYASFLIRYVSADLGLQEFTRALELQPWELRRYEKVAEAYGAVAFAYLQAGDPARARTHLSLAIATADRLAAKATGRAPAGMPPQLALSAGSPLMSFQVGKAQALLGDYRKAEANLTTAHEAGFFAQSKETPEAIKARQTEALIWLSLVEAKLGCVDVAEAYAAEARAAAANADAVRSSTSPYLGSAAPP